MPQNLAGGLVVIDDQHIQAGQKLMLCLRLAGLELFPQRQLEPETRALSQLALEPNPAAHDLCQLLRDRQAKARAAISARQRSVPLSERLEQFFLRLTGNANAGVNNLAANLHVPARLPDSLEPHQHIALLGELDGVADEVGQDLAQPPGVADDTSPYLLVNKASKVQALALGALGQEIHGALHRLAQVERNLLNLQLTRFDF